MPEEASIGAKAFISYTRGDNEDFAGVVDRLKQEIQGRFRAATGRPLEIFLDRESIGWGADWRERIRESVKGATFFIPVITMRYFESEACREELLTFYENASALGVTELILPLVLTGADEIRADDLRAEVRLIESLNYKSIEEAWLSGYESPEWLRAVHSMVLGLKSGLRAAEEALVLRESAAYEEDRSGTDGEQVDADAAALGEDFEELTMTTQRLQAALERFGNAAQQATDGSSLAGLPPKQQQAALVRVAQQLTEPGEELASIGATFESRVFVVDARLRAVVEELRSIDGEAADEQLAQLVDGISGMEELAPIVDQMGGLLQVLRLAAVSSVSMRKGLQPAIKGIQAISNALATVESWRSI